MNIVKKTLQRFILFILLISLLLGCLCSCNDEKEKNDVEKDGTVTKMSLSDDNVYEVGNYIKIGYYEQDNNTSNGPEPIEWLVLDVKDDKALILSKHILDCKQFNKTEQSVTWSNCTLRKWLNNDFYNSAFANPEKVVIDNSRVSAENNDSWSTFGGSDTEDKIFLLSLSEVKAVNPRACTATEYAKANGVSVSSSTDNNSWWLRTPGYSTEYACVVTEKGLVNPRGDHVDYGNNGVRPAMWIKIL